MNQPLAIVVLNYERYQDTVQCVESLITQNYKKIYIIIVDNGSSNESFSILKKHFVTVNNITLIKSNQNLGFAKGNNLGILFAKKNLNCRYILVLNNDTILTSNNILKQLMIPHAMNVGLISPKVVGIDGKQQIGHNWDKDKIIRNTINAIAHTLFDLMPCRIREYSIEFKRFIKAKQINVGRYVYNPSQYQIQGAAFVLTPVFFDYYSIPYPRTFLYCEEINMSWYLHKAKLATLFIETDNILHKEAQTTSATIFGKSKIKIKAKYVIKSFCKSIIMYLSSYDRISKKYYHNTD